MPVKRVEYLLVIFRMCQLMERAVGANMIEQLKAIEELCDFGEFYAPISRLLKSAFKLFDSSARK